jgi:hypothetical protein
VVSSWLLKVVLGIFVVAFLAFELGSPLLARAQADGVAHDVADQMALQVSNLKTAELFSAQCEQEAHQRSAQLLECAVDPTSGNVVVRVRKEARSVLLKNWSVTKNWYHADARATATPK